MPYAEKSYAQTMELIIYPAANVKKSAFKTLGMFCLSVSEAHKEKQSAEADEGRSFFVFFYC